MQLSSVATTSDAPCVLLYGESVFLITAGHATRPPTVGHHVVPSRAFHEEKGLYYNYRIAEVRYAITNGV
jgi:hypothetical protein